MNVSKSNSKTTRMRNRERGRGEKRKEGGSERRRTSKARQKGRTRSAGFQCRQQQVSSGSSGGSMCVTETAEPPSMRPVWTDTYKGGMRKQEERGVGAKKTATG